ncbi:TBC1 domain family member 24 [Eumeta japonica]|uniref:TBC1 domain family member 24 n=1 Tax=Eumeta variegata TaxID=151549 RepID=A0A4C1V248_EUMVA|nr:TBC1 domain family member 24 [Eumeta japonica]
MCLECAGESTSSDVAVRPGLTRRVSSVHAVADQKLTLRRFASNACRFYILFTLWSWLPVRITMYQPVLLYTTEEHGCSLTTFYVRVEHHEPTLLMIKTCNNEASSYLIRFAFLCTV